MHGGDALERHLEAPLPGRQSAQRQILGPNPIRRRVVWRRTGMTPAVEQDASGVIHLVLANLALQLIPIVGGEVDTRSGSEQVALVRDLGAGTSGEHRQ